MQPDTGIAPAGTPAGCCGPFVIISLAIAGVMPGGSLGGGFVAARADVDTAAANNNAQTDNMTRFLKTLTPFEYGNMTRRQILRRAVDACSMAA